MNIRSKITGILVVSSLILIAIGVGVGYFWGFDLLRNTIGENQTKIAKLTTDAIERIINEEIADIELYISHSLRIEEVEKANATYEKRDRDSINQYFTQIDKEWALATENNPLIKEYLDTLASKRLRAIVGMDTGISEIFLTDKFGGLVASSGKTSDFYQADEKWWQEAFAGGQGKVSIQDIEFDESSKVLSLPIASPIRNHLGKVIGVCKAVLDVNRLFEPLEAVRIGKTGHSSLLDGKGYVLFHEGIKPLREKLFGEKDFKKLKDTKKDGWIVTQSFLEPGVQQLISYALVEYPMLLQKGMYWRVCIAQEAKEVFLPLKRLMGQLLALILVLLAVLLVLAYIFSGIFVKPIKRLQEGVERIGDGDLDYQVKIKTGDEIEEFADSFNNMVGNLKKTTTSINSLNKEIENREKVEMALVVAKREIAEAAEIKTKFASIASHEVRGALANVYESLKLVLDGLTGKLNDKQRHFLNMAKEELSRINRLTSDILDFQKFVSGKMKFNFQKNNINTAVKEIHKTIHSLAEQKGLYFKLNLKKDMPDSEFDKDKIIQVLVNLINNAVKFTKKGGITLSTASEGNFIQVTVQDTGYGIKKEDLPELFKTFMQLKTTKEKGTGLGLSICKEITDGHKGKIWAESDFGKGSAFHFILPVKERRSAA